jgi:uncharacterized protein YoxC
MGFYQWCVLGAVIAFAVFVVFAVRAFFQITKTAEAVEYLALTTAEKVDKTQSTFDLLDKASTFVDSGVYRTVAMGIDLFKRLKK